jgi:hypothetical protein
VPQGGKWNSKTSLKRGSQHYPTREHPKYEASYIWNTWICDSIFTFVCCKYKCIVTDDTRAWVLSTRTMESWVGIPLEAWMVFRVVVLTCLDRGPATDRQRVLPNVRKCSKMLQESSPVNAKSHIALRAWNKNVLLQTDEEQRYHTLWNHTSVKEVRTYITLNRCS